MIVIARTQGCHTEPSLFACVEVCAVERTKQSLYYYHFFCCTFCHCHKKYQKRLGKTKLQRAPEKARTTGKVVFEAAAVNKKIILF
jgi:hypothetical protein